MKHRPNRTIGACVVATALLSLAAAQAAVPGVLIKAQTGQRIVGMVKWQPSAKMYVIQPKDSPIQLKFPPEQVESVEVSKPDTLEGAISAVKKGQYGQAIPVLQGIMREYEMLQWDVPAARYLAYAYLKTGDAGKAVTMCERVLRVNSRAAVDRGFARMYWDALLTSEQYARLRKALTTAIESGPRDLAASAQLMRGDIDQQQGNLKEALVDGYLRTIVFFTSVEAVQPEALFKAARCFEQLGQHGHAEKMRKRLLAQFPDNNYAKQLQSGD